MAKKKTKPTEPEYKPERVWLIDTLKPIYQQAIIARLDGADYQEIAVECKVNYSVVRGWFSSSKDGFCKAAYEEITTAQAHEAIERYDDLTTKFKEYAPDALETLRRAAKRSWKAAESLLDRSGFTPEQKIKQTTENSADAEKLKLLRAILHGPKKDVQAHKKPVARTGKNAAKK